MAYRLGAPMMALQLVGGNEMWTLHFARRRHRKVGVVGDAARYGAHPVYPHSSGRQMGGVLDAMKMILSVDYNRRWPQAHDVQKLAALLHVGRSPVNLRRISTTV